MKKERQLAANARMLLRAYYEITGFPVGCTISAKPPYYTGRNVPQNHLTIATMVVKEILKRQVFKTVITDENFKKFQTALIIGRFRNIYDMRDRFTRVFDTETLSGKPPPPEFKTPNEVVKEMPAHKEAFPIECKQFKDVVTNEIVYNDRKKGLLLEKSDYVNCVLTGKSYSKEQLVPIKENES